MAKTNLFNKKYIDIAKLILKKSRTKNYAFIFDLFVDDIKKLADKGINYKKIFELLKKEIGDERLKYKTFSKWVNKFLNFDRHSTS